MTTLLLPPDEVAKIRALKGLAYVLAVMILLDGHYPGRGFTPKEIAMIAGLDERTVSKQLMDLSVLDRVILAGGGYVLTQGGRAMFLAPAGDEALALSPVSVTATEQVLSPDPVNGQALQAQALQIIDARSAPVAGPAAEGYTHTACALEEEVNTLTVFQKTSSFLTYFDAQVAQALNIKLVFGKTFLLFGESVTRFEAPLTRALAVFAHVYSLSSSNKSNIRYPARVAYAMLRENKDPREEIAQDPWKFLPANYLEALGVLSYECRFCPSHDRFSTSKEMDAHLQAAHPPEPEPEPEPIPDEPEEQEEIDNDAPIVDEKAAKVWSLVLDNLRNEMHAAPFFTWVKDAYGIRFDGSKLIVGVRNAATKDWLESRVKTTAERLLVGIVCESVNVVFVVTPVSHVSEQ